jgi:hypothetical protein
MGNLSQMFEGIKIAHVTCRPEVWWRTTHAFLQPRKKHFSFGARYVEIFHVEIFHSFEDGAQELEGQ